MKTRLTHLKPGLLAIVAAVTLTACAGGVSVMREDVAMGYDPEELYVVGTGENELRTVVVGDPFGMPKEAFQTAVLASLDGRNFGPRLNLSIVPRREDPRMRHVVIAFNPAKVTQANALCAGPMETALPAHSGGDLTVTGVYCAGDLYITEATARSNSVPGPDTAQFRKLMTQLALALFPPQNPHFQLDENNCVEDC